MAKKSSNKAPKAPKAPNSSNIVPAGDGNTTASPAPATEQESGRKHWFITLKAKDSSNSSIRSWVTLHCTTAIWQKEKGNESGYEHIQLTMTMKKKCRFTWIKNHFSIDAHVEIVRNIDKSYDYCQKNDTRIGETQYYPERINKVTDPLEGKEYYPWQKDIINIISKQPDDRSIYWYWEENGNVGKSAFCKHLVLKYDAQYVLGKKTDIYHAISDSIKILLIDIPRTCQEFTPYEVIESIKNGMIFSGKYESKTKVFNPPHVIVFANFKPIKEKVSLDRWRITNISLEDEED